MVTGDRVTTSSSPWRRSWVSRGVAFAWWRDLRSRGRGCSTPAAGSPCRAGLRRRRQPAGVRGRRRHGTEGPRSPYPPRPRRSHLRRRRASRTPGREEPSSSAGGGATSTRPARGPRRPSTAGRTPHHGPDPRNAPSPRWRRWPPRRREASPPPSRPPPSLSGVPGHLGRPGTTRPRRWSGSWVTKGSSRAPCGGRTAAARRPGWTATSRSPRRARQWRCGRSRGPSTRARWTRRARTRTHRRPGRAGRSPGCHHRRHRRHEGPTPADPARAGSAAHRPRVGADAGPRGCRRPASRAAQSTVGARGVGGRCRARTPPGTVRAGRAGPVLVPVVAGGRSRRPCLPRRRAPGPGPGRARGRRARSPAVGGLRLAVDVARRQPGLPRTGDERVGVPGRSGPPRTSGRRCCCWAIGSPLARLAHG